MSAMSSSSEIQKSSSTPNFQPVFIEALKEYKKKTGKDLAAHPLAEEIKSCDTPEAILAVLQGKANDLKQYQSSDERLTKWLTPTVNVLNALSATLGESVGTVSPGISPHRLCPNIYFQIFPPTQIIFSGISILLVVSFLTWSHDVCDNVISRRRQGTRQRAARRLSNSSRKSKTSSYASRPTPRSHRLWR